LGIISCIFQLCNVIDKSDTVNVKCQSVAFLLLVFLHCNASNLTFFVIFVKVCEIVLAAIEKEVDEWHVKLTADVIVRVISVV